jgi:hypothetical protein
MLRILGLWLVGPVCSIGKRFTSRCYDASFHGSADWDVSDANWASTSLTVRQLAIVFVACGVLLTSDNMGLL